MKTTISKFVNSDKALGNLLEQKLPLNISIQLGKVIEEIKPIYEQINTFRKQLLEKHGEEIIEEGHSTGRYSLGPEAMKQFEDEMRKEFEVEVELTSPQIDPDRIPEACITAADAIALSWLWKEEIKA